MHQALIRNKRLNNKAGVITRDHVSPQFVSLSLFSDFYLSVLTLFNL
jgi:hypothetical protein